MSKKSVLTCSSEKVAPVGSKVLNYVVELRNLSEQLICTVNDKLSCISNAVPPSTSSLCSIEVPDNNYPPYFSELNYQLQQINENLTQIFDAIKRVEL